MDDSTGSDEVRWGTEDRVSGTGSDHDADGDSGPDRDQSAEPDDGEVFRRGHAPADEPRVVRPGTDAPDERRGAEDGGGNVAGPSPGSVRMPVEPGSPSAENVFFVLLGVALTLFVFARMAGL